MKYDVNIYIAKDHLPRFGRCSLTPSEVIAFLSVVLRRQMVLSKNEFRISVSKSVGSSRSLLQEGTLDFNLNENLLDFK